MSTMALHCEIKTVDQMTRQECDYWQGFQRVNPELASPYFDLGYARILAGLRADTRLAVLYQNGTPAAFLPFHASRFGFARPLSGPMGDHHGLICEPFTRTNGALRKGLPSFTYHGALASQALFHDKAQQRQPSWVVDLSAGYDAYLDDRRTADAKAMRNIRSRQRKLNEGDFNIVYRLDDTRPDALAHTLAVKRAQYAQTRATDVFTAQWSNQLVETLFATDGSGLRGRLSTVEVDGQIIAAHFGMQNRDVLHYWFPVYDPAWSKFGPGLTLFLEIARQLAEEGVSAIHLGPGDMDFKKRLANAHFDVVSGRWFAPSLTAAVVRTGELIDTTARALPLGPASHWPGKAFRRLGKMSAVHGF